ncbi:MAG: 50S ribosomal protein L11 methyltransferase [Bacteroidota bacterium]
MQREYVLITIKAPSEVQELLIGALDDLGCLGYEQTDTELCASILKGHWSKEKAELLRSFFKNLRAEGIISSSDLSLMMSFSIATVFEEDWNSAWERSIEPIRVSPHIVITPSWKRDQVLEYEGSVVVTIDPKMAFGTGYHETTRLMLRLIEKHLRPGYVILDVGTGSGILAIAALKLGASHALGVDVDEGACENAQEMAVLNGVENRFQVRCGSLEIVPERGFDLILVNITLNVIKAIIGQLALRLNPGGKLILSGFYKDDKQVVVNELARLETSEDIQLCLVDELTEVENDGINGWIALVIEKR